MAEIESPFIINKLACFNDDNFVYFLLPFINGGDLYNVLAENKKLDENK